VVIRGRTSFKVIEGDFPHIVEMLVPLGGFGKHLDAMYDWHRARGIEDRDGRGQRINGRDIVAWCFKDANAAPAFAVEFAEFTKK
jgi:hypothetical protein